MVEKKRCFQLMTYCGGIRDKPTVTQSNYTAIVMGFKLASPLCQNTDPGSEWGWEHRGGGLLISDSDPAFD